MIEIIFGRIVRTFVHLMSIVNSASSVREMSYVSVSSLCSFSVTVIPLHELSSLLSRVASLHELANSSSQIRVSTTSIRSLTQAMFCFSTTRTFLELLGDDTSTLIYFTCGSNPVRIGRSSAAVVPRFLFISTSGRT